MLDQIIMAGSGGQGIQLNGQILARAAVHQGLEATYVPTYGAERRGGPSFCAVAVADQPIYATLFNNPDVFLAFDQRARTQYAASVKASGVIVANTDLATQPAPGEKARVISISASRLAEKVHSVAPPLNLVMLGAYLALGRGVNIEALREMLEVRFLNKKPVLQSNLKALDQGVEAVRSETP